MGILIDTSALVELEREGSSWVPVLEKAGDQPVFMAAIGWGELMAGVHLADSVPRALKRREKLEKLRAMIAILPFTAEIGELWAELFASLQRSGTPVPSNDLCIASTAVFHGHQLLIGSAGEKHFRQIPRLKLISL